MTIAPAGLEPPRNISHHNGYYDFETKKFVYHIKDYLGTPRVTFTDVNKDNLISPADDILETKTLYPFGMHAFGTRAAGYVRAKEDFTGHDLSVEGYNGVHDMNARQYVSGLGLFGGVDPLAKYNPSESSYNYVGNDPVNYIDPSGGFRIPASFRSDFPHIVDYLENQLEDYFGRTTVSAVLFKFSGGNLSMDQIAQDFNPKEGPSLKAWDSSFSQYHHETNTINLSRSRLQKINRILGSSGSRKAKQIALIDFISVFINEYVHYGDAIDGFDLNIDANGKLYNDQPESSYGLFDPQPFEEGNKAVDELFPTGFPFNDFEILMMGIQGVDENGNKRTEKAPQPDLVPDPPRA